MFDNDNSTEVHINAYDYSQGEGGQQGEWLTEEEIEVVKAKLESFGTIDKFVSLPRT